MTRINFIKEVIGFFFLCLAALPILPISTSAASKDLPQSASDIELGRYMGRWYEIASFPNILQKGCRCTSSNYEIEDESIIVKNRCLKGIELKTIEGRGWVVPGSNQSQLKVQFIWPIKRNYWIIYVDASYQEAIVGTPDKKHLWVLARNPQVSKHIYQQLTDVASQQGYNIAKLHHTDQSCKT